MNDPGRKPWRYYEDLRLDEPEYSGSYRVTREEIIEFAKQFDPQWFHTDPEAVGEHKVFDDVVASGVHTIALWRRLDHEIARDIRWICGIAWEDVRWPRPLRPGTVIRARSTFVDKRPSERHRDRGVVTCLYELLDENDERVFTCRSISLVERRRQD